MKIFLVFFCVVLFQSAELSEVRKKYPAAAESKEASAAFLEMLKNVDAEDSKTLLAYKGAAGTLQAKYAKTIGDKKKYFLEGASLVEQAVTAEPSNIEIRLIRLSIQENTPKILNYRKNIAEDKTFIVQNLSVQNRALHNYVLQYALKSKAFSEAEKALLRQDAGLDNRN